MIDINEKLYTTESRRHTYRILPVKQWDNYKPLYTGVQFYDRYCNKWRDSAMEKRELIEL